MAQPVLIEVAEALPTSFRASPERRRGGELRWASGAGMPTDFTFALRLRSGQAGGPGELRRFAHGLQRSVFPALGHNACPQPVKVGDAGPYNTLSGLVNAVCPRTTYSKLPWGLPQGRIAALS